MFYINSLYAKYNSHVSFRPANLGQVRVMNAGLDTKIVEVDRLVPIIPFK